MRCLTMTTEIWASVPGFSDYVASSLGRIMSIRSSPGHSLGRPLAQRVDPFGYVTHCLIGDDGKGHTVRAHVAVLSAFKGARPPKHDGSHLSGNKLDNRLGNLEWETSSENHQRKLAHGTLIHGEKHKCSKLSADQVRAIRSRRGERVRDVGAEYGVSGTLVSRIQRGLAWPHVA